MKRELREIDFRKPGGAYRCDHAAHTRDGGYLAMRRVTDNPRVAAEVIDGPYAFFEVACERSSALGGSFVTPASRFFRRRNWRIASEYDRSAPVVPDGRTKEGWAKRRRNSKAAKSKAKIS